MDPQNQNLEDDVKQVMQTLPPVIRTYLTQGRYTAVARNMMTKYGLRIDQGGVLEREIMLLLMGVENPDEFVQALAEEAHLDRETVDGIVQDVNAQIFVPLREEERRGAAPPSAPRAMSAPAPRYIPQPPQPPVSSGEGQTSPTPRSMESDRLLEDHEEPHIEFNKVPPRIPEPRFAPPILQTEPPAPPRPAAIPVTPANPALPRAYSSDPYREPIDENSL
ncbi:hypothetical protein HY972_00830 [Candidatus Kaiserbacteria bacterium]|nr:hypothetical protein [Candidatus Kaiserbacteria bacterium]